MWNVHVSTTRRFYDNTWAKYFSRLHTCGSSERLPPFAPLSADNLADKRKNKFQNRFLKVTTKSSGGDRNAREHVRFTTGLLPP